MTLSFINNIKSVHRLKPNATRFPILSYAALFVGQDSSPAADVHAGLFVLGYGCFRCAKSGSWRTRADLEVCPTTAAAFPMLKPVLPAEACATLTWRAASLPDRYRYRLRRCRGLDHGPARARCGRARHHLRDGQRALCAGGPQC